MTLWEIIDSAVKTYPKQECVDKIPQFLATAAEQIFTLLHGSDCIHDWLGLSKHGMSVVYHTSRMYLWFMMLSRVTAEIAK